MSRWLEFLNWIAIVPYTYLVFFLGFFVGSSSKTSQISSALFWGYLAVFPVTVVVCNLLGRESRKVGWRGKAALWMLVPWGILAVLVWVFPAFVNLLLVCFD
jgi:hypothetical protein